MFTNWIINRKETEDSTLEEFNNGDVSIWGFLSLQIGEYQLGDMADSTVVEEGDSDIEYCVNKMIECGISLLKGREFIVACLISNLLEIHASYGDVVKISIVNISNNETEYIYIMDISDFITEIKFVYAKYIEDVREINEDILNTQFIARTNDLYRDFLDTISHAGLR